MTSPTLDDTASDLERLKTALSQAGCDIQNTSTGVRVMRQLAKSIREDNWHVSVSVLRKK